MLWMRLNQIPVNSFSHLGMGFKTPVCKNSVLGVSPPPIPPWGLHGSDFPTSWKNFCYIKGGYPPPQKKTDFSVTRDFDPFPYLSIEELLKVRFKRLWESGWEGVIFQSFSLAIGEIVWFKVVCTDVVKSRPQLLWNFQMGFHFWLQQKNALFG